MGKRKRAREQIYDKLVEGYGEKHPNVFKGYAPDTLATGWHYRKFGRSNAIFLGTSLQEALETIQEWIWQREG